MERELWGHDPVPPCTPLQLLLPDLQGGVLVFGGQPSFGHIKTPFSLSPGMGLPSELLYLLCLTIYKECLLSISVLTELLLLNKSPISSFTVHSGFSLSIWLSTPQ